MANPCFASAQGSSSTGLVPGGNQTDRHEAIQTDLLAQDRLSHNDAMTSFAFMRQPDTLPEAISGGYALQGGKIETQAHLVVYSDPQSPLVKHMQFWLTPLGSPNPITHYTREMQKFAHVIIVSDDFSWFTHVHPQLLDDGRFVLAQQFPYPGRYHMYYDTVPTGDEQQVFRMDITVGKSTVRPAMDTQREQILPGLRQTDGPFSVTLNTAKVQAGKPNTVAFEVEEYGKPYAHLQPFLGVGAHAIILNTHDLSYEHTHPMPDGMNMSGDGRMSMSDMMQTMPVIKAGEYINPDMQLTITLKRRGLYRMWLQFKDQEQKTHTVSFLLQAV